MGNCYADLEKQYSRYARKEVDTPIIILRTGTSSSYADGEANCIRFVQKEIRFVFLV